MWFSLGCWLAALGVVLGAFGAHGLKARLSAEMMAAFETGVRYHLVGALALIAVSVAASQWPGPRVQLAGWLFTAGIALFSGSLYLLSLTETRWLGAITPLGGLCFIVGWIVLALSASQKP